MSPAFPRQISLATLFFKAFAGFGAGLIGTLALLIFLFSALRGVGAGSVGPFLAFGVFITGLITSLAVNMGGVYIFNLIDREKYPAVKPALRHVAWISITIFVFLLPVYLVAASQGTQTISLILALNLILTAQASMYILELSATRAQRDNLLAVYSISAGMLASLVVNIAIFAIAAAITTTVSKETGAATNSGATYLLFAALPVTWFSLGWFTTMTEMLYNWAYRSWGIDFLEQSLRSESN